MRYLLVVSVLCVAGSATRDPAYVRGTGPAEGGPAWRAFGAATLHAQQPEPMDEFVPIDQLPPQDQLPAAPLLISAYAFVVLALFVYVLSVARRLGQVQQELTRLESEIGRGRRT